MKALVFANTVRGGTVVGRMMSACLSVASASRVALACAALVLTSVVLTPPTTEHNASVATAAEVVQPSSVVAGWGDQHGYHIDVLEGRTTREVALLRPSGVAAASWTGYQCTSGSGRFAAVTVAPKAAANSADARAHGAVAYAVNLVTGGAVPVVDGVTLAYHTPGCGVGDRAAFGSYHNDDTSTSIVVADLSTGRPEQVLSVAGQVTSVVPASAGVFGVRGGHLIRVDASSAITDLGTVGAAFDLQPTHDGGVDYLTAQHDRAVLTHEAGGVHTTVGSGRSSGARLVNGHSGVPVAVGIRAVEAGTFITAGAAGPGWQSVSQDGRATLTSSSINAVPGTFVLTQHGRARSLQARGLTAATTVIDRGPALAELLPAIPREKFSAPGSGTRTTRTLNSDDGSPCSVPRNDAHRQSLQPSAAQVDWAIEKATRNQLTGGLGRPAGYANLGFPAYSANGDFPSIPLANRSGDGASTVPPIVFEAIAAQESNFSQASFHALPGIAGNPLIADYYGNGGNSVDKIDYDKTDCGYGIAQVTSGMRSGETAFSTDKQVKIAIDYQENIAAGLQILQEKWNDLSALGIYANNGSPAYLENWYFAAWAYNTGIHSASESAHGTAGLGWSNNPANPDYPPNRAPYLRDTYADAAHPASWPYQERIMGWMGSPLLQYGKPAYAHASYPAANWLQIPPLGVSCASTNYCTPPGAPGAAGCSLPDYQCWWTGHATWIDDCPARCSRPPADITNTDVEPKVANPHPPTCNLDGHVPSTDAGAPIVVDDLTGPTPLNVVGCTQSPNWKNRGTFTYTAGSDSHGQPVGAIDTHQLGAGFGGRILFTHIESRATPGLINTGTWKPDLPSQQYYDLRIHMPATGAEAPSAVYTLVPGPGAVPIRLTIDQRVGENWINAGAFGMTKGATLTLTNAGLRGVGTTDIAFDAVAFVPQGGHPSIQRTGLCPAIDYIAARGSGQNGPGKPRWSSDPDDPLGMGPQLAPIGKALKSNKPAGSVTRDSIGYLADQVYTPRLPTTYIRDVDQGVELTLALLRQHYTACGRKQHFVLAGYSSGAMVMHRTLTQLITSTSAADNAILANVDAVVLIADGDRKGRDLVHHAGTAPHSSRGVAWATPVIAHPSSDPLPQSVGKNVLSVCDKLDAVCDPGSAVQFAKGIWIHTHHYKTAVDQGKYIEFILVRMTD